MNKKTILIKLLLLFLLLNYIGCKGQKETNELSVNLNTYNILAEYKINDSTNLKVFQNKNEHLVSILRNQKIIDTIEIITKEPNTAFSSNCNFKNYKTFAIVYEKCIDDKYIVAQAFEIKEKNDKLIKISNKDVVCLSEMPCDSNEDYDEIANSISIQNLSNWRLNCNDSNNFYFDENVISQITIKNLFSLNVSLKKVEPNIYEVYFLEFTPLIPLKEDIDIDESKSIANVKLKNSEEIEFDWFGFTNRITKERNLILNPFDEHKNPITLKKCK